MKISHLFLTASVAFLSGEAFAQQAYEKGKPGDSNYEYLNSYGALKDYIDCTKYPNFKLGVGTTASEYIKKSTEFKRTNANFTEVVTGNAMKYASNVKNDGSMDFTTVRNFVKAASDAGQNIYGHTLAWHAQQNTTFLNGIIKDKPAPEIDGDTVLYVDFATKDFRTQQSVGWHSDYSTYHYTIGFDAADGLHANVSKKATNFWDVQYIAMDNIATEQGKNVRMFITLKGSGSGTIHSKLGDWDGGPTANISFTTEWREVPVDYKGTKAGSFLLLQHGDFVGDVYIRKIRFASMQPALKTTENRRCLVFETAERESNVWDNQFWVVTSGFTKGQSFTFSADIRADKAAKVSTQVHGDPTSYVGSSVLGTLDFTTDWKTVTISGTVSNTGKSIAFNLSELSDAHRD